MPGEQETREVSRRVKKPLDDVKRDAAITAGMNPDESAVVSAEVTADGYLKLYLEGEGL